MAIDPGDAEFHYHLGDALVCIDGEEDRAIVHLRLALKLRPPHARAAAQLAEIEADDVSMPPPLGG